MPQDTPLPPGKIVRDRIPGFNPQARYLRLKDAELRRALDQKIDEELAELRRATTRSTIAEELADLLEVIYATAASQDISEEHLRYLREQKILKKGGFSQGIFWQYPTDPPGNPPGNEHGNEHG